MRKAILCLLAALPIFGSCAQEAPHAGQPTAQAQSMRIMRADVDTIRAFVGGSTSGPEAEKAANDLVAWSNKIGELFPPDEAPKQYLYMTSAMASGAPGALRGTTVPLLAAVKTGDRATTGEQLVRTEHDGCGYCHLQPYPQSSRLPL